MRLSEPSITLLLTTMPFFVGLTVPLVRRRRGLSRSAPGSKIISHSFNDLPTSIIMLAFRQYSVDAVPMYTEYPSVNQQYPSYASLPAVSQFPLPTLFHFIDRYAPHPPRRAHACGSEQIRHERGRGLTDLFANRSRYTETNLLRPTEALMRANRQGASVVFWSVHVTCTPTVPTSLGSFGRPPTPPPPPPRPRPRPRPLLL